MLQYAKQFVQRTFPPSILLPYRAVKERVRRPLRRVGLGLDSFLADVDSVVHVGGHIGQERDDYSYHDLDVLWIEANPQVFEILRTNIRDLPKQRAVQALVSDHAGVTRTLHIASNQAAASSILPFGDHRQMFPTVHYCDEIALESTTLPALLDRPYQALVMDIQGAELKTLKGCGDLIRQFDYIKTETADFGLYQGYPLFEETQAYLASFGFREHRRKTLKTQARVGTVFDVVFKAQGGRR